MAVATISFLFSLLLAELVYMVGRDKETKQTYSLTSYQWM